MKGSIALCAHKDCLLFLFPLPDLDIAEFSEPAAVTKLLNPDIHGNLFQYNIKRMLCDR